MKELHRSFWTYDRRRTPRDVSCNSQQAGDPRAVELPDWVVCGVFGCFSSLRNSARARNGTWLISKRLEFVFSSCSIRGFRVFAWCFQTRCCCAIPESSQNGAKPAPVGISCSDFSRQKVWNRNSGRRSVTVRQVRNLIYQVESFKDVSILLNFLAGA